ncbi:hypothetical protein Q0812_13410 [Brevundimonas sp. 2R-24]|uniref:Uncharacterized protein n=1 Tax=Peiella sedimenti TaxID=3061083 RepID=A0ABT8SPB8_9CAUL|nr:hypothetical protein [Caulobacteraceae bacterium XZ-24]
MIDLQSLPRGTTYTPRLISKGHDLESRFGGTDIRINRMGDRWALDVDVPAIKHADCGMALIADLNAGWAEGVSLAWPQPGLSIRGRSGAVLVEGGAQTGTTLSLKGGKTGFLIKKGQFVSVAVTITGGTRRYLYQSRADTRIAADGTADLPIWPMVRRSPADEDAVEILSPRIEGKLIGSGQEWTLGRLNSTGLRFTIQEFA